MRLPRLSHSTRSSAAGNSERSAAFRRRHRQGDLVSGRVVRDAGNGMAWIAFDGEPLLTNIGNCPAPGTVLNFEILQLQPEIRLREAPNRKKGRGNGLAVLVQDFFTSRAAFESALDSLDMVLPADQEHFLSVLPPDVHALWERVNQCVQAINSQIANKREERLSYPPWLAPRSRELELLCTPPDQIWGHAVLGLRLAPFGVVQIRAVLHPPQMRCRVYADQPKNARKLAPLMLAAVPCPQGEWDLTCGAAEKLPKRHRGGLPAELLAPMAPHFNI